MGFLDAVESDVDAKCVCTMLCKLGDVSADAAADIQHAATFKRRVVTDEAEAPVLPKPPDVTGVTEGNGGVFAHSGIIQVIGYLR